MKSTMVFLSKERLLSVALFDGRLLIHNISKYHEIP